MGFDVASLRAGGFDDYALVRSGLFNSTQLRTVGCDIQRIALMALFEALDGKHWRHKENWASATQPIGHWYGVHLDGAGHIYKLDLRSNGLKGMYCTAMLLLFICALFICFTYLCILRYVYKWYACILVYI